MKITKTTIKRALRTFIQAAIAYIVANIALVDFASGKDVAKSAIVGLAVSALAAGIAAVMNLEGSEQGGGTMTYDAFVKKYLGKATDIDGTSGVQCVDLAKMFILYVLGVKPQSIGNAHAYYDNFDNTYLKNHFTKIKYTKGLKPQKGDLVVWGRKYNGTSEYGHIALATGEATDTTVTTYDQNWGGKEMKKVVHSCTGIAGYLRPKDQSNLKSNKPSVKIDQVVTMITQAYCYKDKEATRIYTVAEILKINPGVKSELISTKPTDKARYRPNTKCTVKSVNTTSKGDLMIKTPTCYIKVYSYVKDKSYVK